MVLLVDSIFWGYLMIFDQQCEFLPPPPRHDKADKKILLFCCGTTTSYSSSGGTTVPIYVLGTAQHSTKELSSHQQSTTYCDSKNI